MTFFFNSRAKRHIRPINAALIVPSKLYWQDRIGKLAKFFGDPRNGAAPRGMEMRMAGVTAPRGGFQADFHNLRAVAIILIVGAHTLPSLEWKDQGLMFMILDTICNESSVIFFSLPAICFTTCRRDSHIPLI